MASRIFQQDNPYSMFMNRVGDLAMLSVAWFICSIPVVTIGASTQAACEMAREMLEGTDQGVFRGFWRAFKRRFTTSLAMTLIVGLFWGVAAADLWIMSAQRGDTANVLYGVTLGVIVVVGVLLAYVFPLASRSKLSAWKQITRSVKVSIAKPVPALLIFAMNVLPIVLLALVPGAISWVPLVWFIIGGGATSWFTMILMRRNFDLD